jgi:ABC-type Fe3+/spermidine/putrescine transport system ATPase subunit
LGEALRLLQQHNGMGMILATRYAPDARAMADRIMVLRDGQLVQEGDSVTLYEQPSCAYAARALGEVNLIPGHTYGEVDGLALVIVETGAHVEAMLADAQLGQPCWVTVRPERLAVAAMSADEMGEGAVAARVISLVHHGDHVRLVLSVGTTRIVARRPPGPAPTVGAEVCIAWQAQNACAVQREGA